LELKIGEGFNQQKYFKTELNDDWSKILAEVGSALTPLLKVIL
jgi:hypothetical protein